MAFLGKLWAGYKKYRLIVRMVAAVIGVVVGISAGIAFGRVYGNINAAVWAVVSAIYAALYFKTNLKVHRDVRRITTARHFTIVSWIGFVGLLAALVGFGTYLYLGIKTHEKGVVVRGYFIVTVWTFMTFKWSIFTFFGARKFKRMYAQSGEQEGIINS